MKDYPFFFMRCHKYAAANPIMMYIKILMMRCFVTGDIFIFLNLFQIKLLVMYFIFGFGSVSGLIIFFFERTKYNICLV